MGDIARCHEDSTPHVCRGDGAGMAGTAKNEEGRLLCLPNFTIRIRRRGKERIGWLDGKFKAGDAVPYCDAENVGDGNKVCAIPKKSGERGAEQISCLTRFSYPRSRAATIEWDALIKSGNCAVGERV